MVLPVQGLPGGKPKKGRKGKGPPDGSVQVNLIVDPSMFGHDPERGRNDEEDDEDDGSSAIPGSYSGASNAGQRRRAPKRRGIFAGLAREEQWKRARRVLKWGVTVDAFGMLLWGMEFVLILLGKRCPVGGYLGWYVLDLSLTINSGSITLLVGAMHTTLAQRLHAYCVSRLP